MSSHNPNIDKMTPAEIRVLAEYLLYTMDYEQRTKLMKEHPGLYGKIFPDHYKAALQVALESL